METLKLVDVRKKLDELYDEEGYIKYISSTAMSVPENVVHFVKVLSGILPQNVSIDELLFTIQLLIKDIEKGQCGFHNSSIVEKDFENLLQRLKVIEDFPIVLSFIPRVIDAISDTQFSLEFSKRYKKSVLGLLEIEEAKGDYGYIEVKENVIDISNKDKAEVLAELYNNSQPMGMGMAQYDPTPMTVEIARKILEKTQSFDYLKGRPLKIDLEGNIISVCGYNHDNAKGLAQKVISSCRNINDIGKDKLKRLSDQFENQIKQEIEREIEKKHKERQNEQEYESIRNRGNSGLDYLRVSESDLQPIRRLIEESGYDISETTLEFIKNVENQAYPEAMKMMQDVEDIEELEDLYNYYLFELTVARNNDWYIIYGEDEDSIEIVDIASLPNRDRDASRQEIHNYLTRVINQKAHVAGKQITLNAKEDTSYRMIQRMVNNGEYEILEDETNTWENNDEIVMHNLVLRPILQRDRGYGEE